MQKRSLTIAGHRTSIALEPEFWSALEEIATLRGLNLAELIAQIDSTRETNNLSSSVRVMVLKYYQLKESVSASPVTSSD